MEKDDCDTIIRKALGRLNPDIKDSVHYITALYGELDKKIEDFKKAAGLKCAVGCGDCCKSLNVEATVLELLPLVIYLWEKNEAEYWLEKLRSNNAEQLCVFYEPSLSLRAKGCCLVHSLRPLVCRLFGFSAVKDKYGRPSLVTCGIIKKTYADNYQKVLKLIDDGISVPKMTDFSIRISAMGSDLGKIQMPINEAMKKAFEKIGLYLVKIETSEKIL